MLVSMKQSNGLLGSNQLFPEPAKRLKRATDWLKRSAGGCFRARTYYNASVGARGALYMFTRILARAGDFRKDFRKGTGFSQESIITRLLEQGEHFRCSQGCSRSRGETRHSQHPPSSWEERRQEWSGVGGVFGGVVGHPVRVLE